MNELRISHFSKARNLKSEHASENHFPKSLLTLTQCIIRSVTTHSSNHTKKFILIVTFCEKSVLLDKKKIYIHIGLELINHRLNFNTNMFRMGIPSLSLPNR